MDENARRRSVYCAFVVMGVVVDETEVEGGVSVRMFIRCEGDSSGQEFRDSDEVV